VHRAVAAVQRVAVAAVARHTGYCIGFTRISCIAAGIAIAITIAVAVAIAAAAAAVVVASARVVRVVPIVGNFHSFRFVPI